MRRLTAISAVLLLAAPFLSCNAQIKDSWERREWDVVTTVEDNALAGNEYGSEGIINDWQNTLKAFYEYGREDDAAIDRKVEENSVFGDNVTIKTLGGMELLLPRIPDENGTDLFMLTRDGITIYMAIDNPAYLQEVDDEIIKWVRLYAVKRRAWTRKIFARYERWEPLVKPVFEGRGVPTELADLCLIESGCNLKALSSAGALGMWQIMPETGRRFGLVIRDGRDDRLDPSLATPAAAKILLNNYISTGDWTLAAAAYNCGSGRLRKNAKGTRTWDEVKDSLPNETRHYIPSLLAMHYVWTYRKELGF